MPTGFPPRRRRYSGNSPSGRLRIAASRIAALAALSAPFWLGYADTASPMQSCDLALSLVFDVSSSMDDAEFGVMRDGIAASLLDDDIWRESDGTLLQVVFFAEKPLVVVPWVSAAARGEVAERISGMTKRPPMIGGMTGLGAAIGFVANQMPRCDRQVIDVAGDGENNVGPMPSVARQEIDPAIEINALATTAEAAQYYRTFVIQGPQAFVQPVSGFADFEKAMKDKLTRELYLG